MALPADFWLCRRHVVFISSCSVAFRSTTLLLAGAVTACCASGRSPDTDAPTFQYAANGAQAPILKTVVANTTDGASIGLASSSSMCGERLFLVDPRNSVVHEIRLSDGLRVKTFGNGDPNGLLKAPESVVANCEGNSVVVQDGGSLLHYDMTSTAFVRRTKRAPTAGPALGFASMNGMAAVFPGYWVTDRAALSREPSHALSGFSIGYRVDLGESGESAPLLPLVTDGCRSMSSNCLDVGIDEVAGMPGGWIACQGGGGSMIGVYSPSGELQRRVETRSPLFLDDRTTAAASATITSKIQWHQRNSALRFCAAFANYIIAVHYTLEPGEWSPGKAMTPRVLMNIHGLDGTPISADIGLRDVPVAKDAHNLYVLVYGESRKNSGGPRLQIDTIQITDSDGNLNQQLRQLGG